MDPVLVHIGRLEIRYYGLMYIAAFATVYALSVYRVKSESLEYSKNTVQNYLIWAMWGLMIGARFGYVLFYNFGYYMSHPLETILPFSFQNGFHFTGIGGMSYHGGLIGVIVASLLFCMKHKTDFWRLSDLIIPTIPLGYTFGRIGNFINGELYGRVTTMPWGMYFPLDQTQQLRHPSQLYEAFFEGIVLFVILWSVRRKVKFSGILLALYLIGYGLVRFFIEFVREPDSHLGFVFGPFSMGQLLCLAMIAGGGIFLIVRKKSAEGISA
jgi:phosphatidylglycerol:prolipoprotein diacylglycerol transferase